MKKVLLATMLCAFAAPNFAQVADAAAVIDPNSVSGDGEMSLSDDLAIEPVPQVQHLPLSVSELGSNSFALDTPDASISFDYEITDGFATGGDNAIIRMSASGSGGEFTGGSAEMSLTFTTIQPLWFEFSPSFHPLSYTSGSLNGQEVERYWTRFEPDQEGGNYDSDDWPRNGILQPGEHTLSFTASGSDYRGAGWNHDSSLDLELTAVPMPEPTSAALLSLGVLAALHRRRR